MASRPGAFWSELVSSTLACYDDDLLRRVAGRLVKPRNYWPADELVKRCAETLDNPPVLDRRREDLEPPARHLLALIGLSRQPCWAVGNLVELVLALGGEDGLKPVLDLLDAGLLYPLLGPAGSSPADGPQAPPPGVRLRNFELWLATAGPAGLAVFCPPQIASRAVDEELPIPDLLAEGGEGATPPLGLLGQEADGLEWLLRLGVLWQQVCAAPLRRTQGGGFFKRDVERIEQDLLLNGPPTEHLATVRDIGFLVTSLAEREGILREADGEVKAGPLPTAWDQGLPASIEALWADLYRLDTWTPLDGWKGGMPQIGNPFPSAYLLAFLLLARLPEGAWVQPVSVEDWLALHHPYWQNESLRPSRQQPWLEGFLLGVAYHLRLVQVARDSLSNTTWVRLTALARWLLARGEFTAGPVYAQTLLVQPNLEILAFRQGLTTSLIARLTRCAQWKTLGAACTLQLQPETVYRALESGETFDSIRLTLEQHGTRAIPPAVIDSLRTWSNKRDRITVYPSATLLEFNTPAELNEALARGLQAVRVADTLAVVAREDDIDFKQFRLTGTRDYSRPPEKCVSVESDGVTLTVDLARSDLLLESELPRFAEVVDRAPANGLRQYRLTPASLSAARAAGTTLANLETWFQQRTGGPASPAARLLLTGAQVATPRLQRHLVLHVSLPELADGLMQWPLTRSLIQGRLGPTSLSVAEEHADQLRARLAEAGITLDGDEGSDQPAG